MSSLKTLSISSVLLLVVLFAACNRRSSPQVQLRISDSDSLLQYLGGPDTLKPLSPTYVHIDSLITFLDGNQVRVIGGISPLEDTLISDLEISHPVSNQLLYEPNPAFGTDNKFVFHRDTLIVTEFEYFPVYTHGFGLALMPFREFRFTSRSRKIRTASQIIAPKPMIPRDSIQSLLVRFNEFRRRWALHSPRGSKIPSFEFITPLWACALTGDKLAIAAFDSLPNILNLDAGIAEEYYHDAEMLELVLHKASE